MMNTHTCRRVLFFDLVMVKQDQVLKKHCCLSSSIFMSCHVMSCHVYVYVLCFDANTHPMLCTAFRVIIIDIFLIVIVTYLIKCRKGNVFVHNVSRTFSRENVINITMCMFFVYRRIQCLVHHSMILLNVV